MAEPIDIPGVYASAPDETSESPSQKRASGHTDSASQDEKKASQSTGLQFSMDSEPAGNQTPQTQTEEDVVRLVDDLPDDFVQPWGNFATRHFTGQYGRVISRVEIDYNGSRKLCDMSFKLNLPDGTDRRVTVSVKRDNWEWNKAVLFTTDAPVELPTGPVPRREPGDQVVEVSHKSYEDVREGIRRALREPGGKVLI
ncbi:hypothetical protein FRC00_012631 [Tulasnella sp. 408]|nr:hypothetical protein FRC00_012631 [Tulasnella sp. 408]